MQFSLIYIAIFIKTTLSEHIISNSKFFCSNTDLHPQTYVDIEQLTGQWYGIEIINHAMDAKHEIVYEDGCPVLTFLEEKVPLKLPPLSHHQISPNYEQNNFDNFYQADFGGYSTQHQADNRRYTTQKSTTTTTQMHRVLHHPEPQNLLKSMLDNEHYRKSFLENMRRLSLTWDENGSVFVYHVRYNVTKAGFWMASGPQNGSALEPKFNSFAGAIHVLKAVGNHMVLVFCHRLPEPQLYSILLSRVQNMSQPEIHGVHNLLNRRGLNTNSIRKVCMLNNTNSATTSSSTKSTLIIIYIYCFIYFIAFISK